MDDRHKAYKLIICIIDCISFSNCLSGLCLLHSVAKCQKNLLLTKNKLTNADDLVEVSKTAVSSCDDDERFDDGTNRENVKCTTARARDGVWSHEEYECHGR